MHQLCHEGGPAAGGPMARARSRAGAGAGWEAGNFSRLRRGRWFPDTAPTQGGIPRGPLRMLPPSAATVAAPCSPPRGGRSAQHTHWHMALCPSPDGPCAVQLRLHPGDTSGWALLPGALRHDAPPGPSHSGGVGPLVPEHGAASAAGPAVTHSTPGTEPEGCGRCWGCSSPWPPQAPRGLPGQEGAELVPVAGAASAHGDRQPGIDSAWPGTTPWGCWGCGALLVTWHPIGDTAIVLGTRHPTEDMATILGTWHPGGDTATILGMWHPAGTWHPSGDIATALGT